MSKSMMSLVYAPWTLTVVFLTLFIVYCVLYYNEKNKTVAKEPIPVIPEWTKVVKSTTNIAMAENETFNTYLVKSTSSAGALTFAAAESVVARAALIDDRLVVVGQEFYLVVNNVSGQNLTWVAGTGNTLTDFATLATASYAIIKVTLTNVTAGEEAVEYTETYTGTNA